jgi:flagellar hook assembly protein FlgD
MTAAPPRRAAVLLFAALVLATCGAVFVTQRLKHSTTIIGRVYFHQWISPNGDGRKDTVALRFDLPRAQRVTVSLVNRRGEEVRRFADDRFLGKGTHPFIWDGRNQTGDVVPDGVYHLRVGLPIEGRSVISPRDLYVDTKPPRPRILGVTPATIVPGTPSPLGQAQVRFTGPTNPPATFGVWRTDTGKPTEVVRFAGRRGRHFATWDGLEAGAPAPEGTYAISVTVQDKAGNRGSAPSVLPPTRAYAAPHSGVTVSYLSLTGSLVPVKAGAIARLTVGPIPRPVHWRLALIGQGGALRSGVSHGSALSVRIPRDAQPAIYSVQITAAGRRASWPVVVGGRGRAAGLVVLPAMTWQGQNRIDSNQDGFPDTLDTGESIPLARPFAHGRPPADIRTQIVPLLRFLDHIRANYDLTTDVDLVRDGGAPPNGFGSYRGLIFAGSQRWLTRQLATALHRFGENGGKVASFGIDAFRRHVSYAGGVLQGPGPPQRVNAFGEQTSVFTSPPAPLVVSQNQLDFFPGTDGFIGSFTRFERSEALPPAAVLLAAAGRDPKPDLVAYRLGKALVIRAGTDQWATELFSSPEVANTTRRIWALISQ